MATKSIFKNISIVSKKDGRAFINALNSSKAANNIKTEPQYSCRTIGKEEVKDFFNQQYCE